LNLLEARDDVEAMLIYEDANCGFLEPHSFLIVCKNVECRSRWYARSDEINYQIYDRIVQTKSKERALTYFDGTTQYDYQWPKKGWETVYCRREPTPFECNYRSLSWEAEVHELDLTDPVKSSFRVEIKELESGETQTSVYATTDISRGSFVLAEQLASSVELSSSIVQTVTRADNDASSEGNRAVAADDLQDLLDSSAYKSHVSDSNKHYVEPGVIRHIRRIGNENEANIGRWLPPHPGKRPKFSPVYERHRVSHDLLLVATRDISEGEELTIYETSTF
jgi:hypothetical protein